MSLKAFHIVFVTVCVLVTFGFGVWAVRHHDEVADSSILMLGVASIASSVGLIAYGAWFLKKLKGTQYL